jgi:DMSO reductase anchor subunit
MTTPSPVELIAATRQQVWRAPAVCNFTLGGLGAGFYAAAAVAAGFGASAGVALAAWLGPALVLAGFVAVAAEAGRPLRGPRVLTRVRTSWMSRELVLGGAFAALALAEWLAPSPAQRALTTAAAMAVVAAQGFLVRRGRAVAAWDAPVMPVLFVASALVSGAGLLLVLEPFIGDGGAHAVAGALVLVPLAFVGWLTYITWSSEAAFERATRPLRETPGTALGVVGYVLPWSLLALAVSLPPLAAAAPLAGALMVAGQAWSKWLLILTVAELRPVTIRGLTLQRRVS